MKKWMFISLVISLVLVLTACSSTQNSAVASASTSLSLEGQLLVGTLKLESTTSAVSTDQANQLLPLWETMASLASSGTAASQEIDSVVSQIQSSMTSQQISSITAMKLNQQNLASASAEAGAASTTSGSAATTNTSLAQSQRGAGAAGAGNPGEGNPPSGAGGDLSALTGAQPAGQAQSSTTQVANSTSTGMTNQVPVALINTLVELLKKKIG
jgi:hypothetical protein